MNLIDWLVILVKLSCIEKFDSEEMRNHSYLLVLFAVLSQKLLEFSGSFSHICRGLSQMLPVHKF